MPSWYLFSEILFVLRVNAVAAINCQEQTIEIIVKSNDRVMTIKIKFNVLYTFHILKNSFCIIIIFSGMFWFDCHYSEDCLHNILVGIFYLQIKSSGISWYIYFEWEPFIHINTHDPVLCLLLNRLFMTPLPLFMFY